MVIDRTIIYLIGHYAVGKLTIARSIAAVSDARLFDNHLANNVIFSLIRADGRTPLPEGVWDMIDVIRNQAFLAMEKLVPLEVSFVLTNCLLETDPDDRAAYEQVEQLAMKRGSVFVPVVLTASDAAYADRMESSERKDRLKWTDVSGALHKRQTTELLRVIHPNRLDIDTTHLSPATAAQMIISHAAKLGEKGR